MDKEQEKLIKRYETARNAEKSIYLDNDEIETLLSYYLDGQANDTEAEYLADMALRLHPDDDLSKLMKVRVLMYREKNAEALELLNQINDEELNMMRYLFMGRIYIGMGNIDMGNEMLHKFYGVSDREDREQGFVYMDIADSYSYSVPDNRFIDKVLYYQLKAYECNPGNMDFINEIAFTYHKKGNQKKCIEFLNRLIDLDPYSLSAWHDIGVAYILNDEPGKALDAFEYALAIEPEDYNTNLQKSALLLKMEKYDEAIESYKRTYEVDDSFVSPLEGIADCYKLKKEYEKVLETANRIIEKYSEIVSGYYYAAEGLFGLGRFRQAVNMADKALKIDDDDEDVLEVKGRALMVEGTCNQEAMKTYQRLLEVDPDNYNGLYGMGQCLLIEEEFGKSEEYLKRAEKQNDDNYMLYIGLAIDYLKTDRRKDMMWALKKAVGINSDALADFFSLCPDAYSQMDDLMDNL